ncbi:unnamed protein product [Rotaria sordida]|uniref:Uncharacterized protein n=1 Tax=Rotaria sordida TaxID=392033 RepID=A0A814MSI5_9BILA|nr:unnamed protein product [Rotaria sordida]CAF1274123.1 unnamed protein product [Rotaria sordida]
MILLLFLVVTLLFKPITGDSCESYTHPTYGKTGQCIKTSDCSNALYISNLCESKPIDIKCCFSGALTACPNIISRAEWGARPATVNVKLATPVPIVVIHHTTAANCTTKVECMARMKRIQNYHMDSQKWGDIGYNFLVGEDGNVYEGRGWNQVGAQTLNYNSKSIGISVVGDYTYRLPNDAALNAVKQLIKCGVSRGYIKSDYLLRGHKDLNNTACPGKVFYEEIKKWPNYRSTTRRSDLGPSHSVPEDYLVMKDVYQSFLVDLLHNDGKQFEKNATSPFIVRLKTLVPLRHLDSVRKALS